MDTSPQGTRSLTWLVGLSFEHYIEMYLLVHIWATIVVLPGLRWYITSQP